MYNIYKNVYDIFLNLSCLTFLLKNKKIKYKMKFELSKYYTENVKRQPLLKNHFTIINVKYFFLIPINFNRILFKKKPY